MSTQKVWFITGASKGMGLEITKTVLKNGGKVIATSRNTETLLEKIADYKGNLLPVKLDITKEHDVEEAISKGIEKFGQIDVVVNNAGYNLLGNIEELSDTEFRETMSINVFALANTIRKVLPHLRKQKSGHIINTSSMMGYMGYAGNGSYNASKFAVIGLSEALAQEVAPFGIKVTILAPGTFRTNFMSEDSLNVAKNKIDAYNLDEQVEQFTGFDGKQLGDPKKLAEVLLKITEMSNPPLHLPLGSDSYNAILQVRKNEEEEMEKWKALSLSTDFK
ncbi:MULTISPECIES: SDR family NAD(P)-dependent oxidoreductase [Mesonia]|uniref:3-oxoacyl-[acyl-carrier-protein] reductase FabG n=1 Tax=Mesonia oceanica TaxID=2687242 RepID=A0AC61YDH7_9FLAO|nr:MULTISPECIES: SDR family NAD(P)-dependent oxidoreductase [Mesonia]MAN29308.1 short-chain dehydrogenase/reductase [Mesonia sp.]MAQ40932.1 short-chain dehydrogenase/reductase [Mesonia sp.]MBJ98395.1 short-chain dehydrogenase/reductase [Flavobacteriaceae bacterium]VVV02295.1 3-oxoacyl-[acyl-carrier-protein] reductase FabG [Mesonia oceanica]|tara:strand:+ start:17341 stop:18174 length:834 start_codon:yes stop_codon:yes gene_type:complete